MPDPVTSVTTYVAALREPSDANLDALGGTLARDVVVLGLFGPGEGLDALRESIRTSPRLALLAGASWSTPTVEGNSARTEATFAPGAAMAGVVLHITVDGTGRLVRVEQELHMAPPPPPTPLQLTNEMKQAIAGALANGTPTILAYVDAAGEPHLSLRGTTQAFGDDQLAMWARERGGGLLKALPDNPHVAVFYRDPATRTSYQFTGRAHVDEDPSVRDTVLGNAPEPERNLDVRRLGAAVIIDLDRIEGTGPAGRIRMERGA